MKMRVPFHAGVFALLVAMLAAPVWPETAASLQVSPEAAPLRESLLSWSRSLKSFSGKYTLTQYWYDQPEHDPETPLVMQVDYRFDGNNRYMMVAGVPLEPSGVLTRFVARYDGKITERSDILRPGRPVVEITVRIDRVDMWPDPVGPYLTPEMFFEAGCDLWSFDEFLSVGSTDLVERNGQRILMHRRYPTDTRRLDIWFDGEGRPESFQHGFGPSGTDDEVRALWDGDPFDFFNVTYSIDVGDYRLTNGVQFPAWARKVWWDAKLDDGIKRRLIDEQRAGKLTPLEFDVERMLARGPRHEKTVQYFQLDVPSVKVNEPLAEEAFTIEIPAGAHVWRGKDATMEVHGSPWYRRLLHPVAVGAVAVGVLGITGWALTSRRRRRRR